MVTATWATVEQDPTGLWWITTNDTTTGPYLDQVQATRALHTAADTPWCVVVHTTTPTALLQCALQTTAPRPVTDTKGGA